MYRDEIFLKLNKHTSFAHFAQNRKKLAILEKIRNFWKKSENFGKFQVILEKV